jgi:hypothetical protein
MTRNFDDLLLWRWGAGSVFLGQGLNSHPGLHFHMIFGEFVFLDPGHIGLLELDTNHTFLFSSSYGVACRFMPDQLD